jgi:hypothetical protein
MPIGIPWSPTDKDLEKAYSLKRKGKRNGGGISDICSALSISKTTYHKHRCTFEKFFRAKERVSRGGPVGRPKGSTKLKLDDIDLDLLEKLILTGYSLEDVAAVLRIHPETLRNYRKQFPEVADVVDNALRRDTAEIMASLSARAKGYDHDATYFASYLGHIATEDYIKHYPPDVEAARLILANRVGFVRDVDPRASNNKGRIIEALDAMMREDDAE